MPNATNCGATPVLALELDRNGNVSKKTMKLDREAQLTNSLLQGLYPGIRVATVDVPVEPLDSCEQAMVEQALTRIEIDGIRYSLVGASGSAKNGKFYAVESSFEKKLGERFRFSPQAAITYFGILVSSCKVLVESPDCRVMVVDDHEFGTNDCRGWISQPLFRKLQQKHQSELLAREMGRLHAQRIAERSEEQQDLPLTDAEERALIEQAKRRIQGRQIGAHRFYQFRLAFDKTQAKGAFKVMADEVTRHLDADIILPRSCVKPKYQGGVLRTIRSLVGDRQAHTFRGPVMVGFRDVSRNLEFNSSYTLLEHAPEGSIELEIKPYALSQIEKVRQAFEANNFTELFQLLGTQESQRTLEPGEEPDPDYTSNEYTVAQAALIADATGYMLKHPFIQHHLQRVLMKWAYRLCTSGGFRLPGFALADDGYLFLHEGQVVCSSDWIPKTSAIAESSCRRGLVVRYPIRMKEDLLPAEILSVEDTVRLLARQLEQRGCQLSAEGVAAVAREQLQLRGTLVLHSETASRNGGDFDFDMVCLVEDNRFPRFVADRFAYEEQHVAVKTKNPKPPSPWWNLPQVSMQARGNQIGAITDLKTSCLAKGRPDLARELLDHAAEEHARDVAEGVRVAYVAATRARDLLVIPAIGDDPTPGSGPQMASEWWVAPLHPAIYPPEARRRKPSLAKQCPKFGMDSVLSRPEGDPADDTNVRPGAHGFGQEDKTYSVVWWDPRVLELGKTPSFSLRQEHLLKEVDSSVIERDLRNHSVWSDQHRATLEKGKQPSLHVQTASERARGEPKFEAGDVGVVEIAGGARPFGPRFGSLVHAVLATVPLDSDAEQIRASTQLHGRIFGALGKEIEAAVTTVASALQHPLMERARKAAACGACHREVPLTLREEDGTLIEGLADLAFQENGKWIVVDFKTDQELAAALERYRRQVAIYAAAISKATSSSSEAFLFRV